MQYFEDYEEQSLEIVEVNTENYSLSKATYEKNIGKHIINTQYLKYKDLSKENEIIVI